MQPSSGGRSYALARQERTGFVRVTLDRLDGNGATFTIDKRADSFGEAAAAIDCGRRKIVRFDWVRGWE